MNFIRCLLLGILALNTAGCGTFVAHSIVRAPNRYPAWLAPHAPVTLAFSPKLLTNFVAHYVDVGPPAAQLHYRIVEPANYHFSTTSSNWWKRGREQFEFHFHATVPGQSNVWTAAPRGTVFLLHGYGLAQFAMLPWALDLAQDGWRCVLVDLRGHGKSTGKRVYFGLVETNDLSQLLNALERDGAVRGPVSAVGVSYGASLALRWKTVEPRLQTVVAIAPYGSLSNAVLNLCHDYAGWFPRGIIRAGLKKLPSVLQVSGRELDLTTVLRRKPVTALFVAGEKDTITPVETVQQLRALASPGSQLLVVPKATHESLPYFFPDLNAAVEAWLVEGR